MPVLPLAPLSPILRLTRFFGAVAQAAVMEWFRGDWLLFILGLVSQNCVAESSLDFNPRWARENGKF